MSNEKNNGYIQTPVYARQLSNWNENKNDPSKAGYYFLTLEVKNVLKNKKFIEDFGEYSKMTMVVADFQVKGAKTSNDLNKFYELDKENDELVKFERLEIDPETRTRTSGKHAIAVISIKKPENTTKITLSKVKGEDENGQKQYETKTIMVEPEFVNTLFIENSKTICEKIKRFKDKKLVSGVQKENDEADLLMDQENIQDNSQSKKPNLER